ncbi:hypothetical protein PRIPAC_78139 [Pristionchus pacificus]|uniref:Uncharacterized protein n=1 Tax=Pristionchus pacificus TaxID=54126 RepID=A0A2A6CM54_PRIPA|nr:hypothetical protein PRIPAC_78139 [Pristionchus pacificus]|eukprot:PDM79133.1 hypothetical protein PRIPAC_31712 [Pristionchus pacificus]
MNYASLTLGLWIGFFATALAVLAYNLYRQMGERVGGNSRGRRITLTRVRRPSPSVRYVSLDIEKSVKIDQKRKSGHVHRLVLTLIFEEPRETLTKV